MLVKSSAKLIVSDSDIDKAFRSNMQYCNKKQYDQK